MFLLLTLAPYILLSFFSQPVTEDFGFSARFQQNDFTQLLITSYQKMNGRYIANIAMYLNPLSFNSFLGYKLVPLFLILLLFLANSFLVSQVFLSTDKIKRLIIATIITLLFLHGMPLISEGLYWYTAASIYQMGLIMTLFYVAMFIKVIVNHKNNGFFAHSLLTLFLFLSCGFNETLTLTITFFITITTFIFYKNNLKNKQYVLIQLFFTLLFLSVMVFAPGNIYREGMYENSHDFFNSLFYSFLQVGRFFIKWIFSLPILIISFLYVVYHDKIIREIPMAKKSFYLKPWMSFPILLSIIFLAVFPPYWFTGILGQHRTLNVAYLFFLLTWFVNLTVWINHCRLNKKLLWFRKQYLAIIFFIVSLNATTNGYHAWKDIFTGDAVNYDAQLKLRNLKLNEASKTQPKKVTLTPINYKPKTLFVTDIDPDPGFWTNQGYNDYYNLKSTKIYITTSN